MTAEPGMRTWVALLRGINVGGNNPLPMTELRALLGGLGCRDVRTYIQSGNCVFRSDVENADELSAAIAAAIAERFGFRPRVLVLSPEALDAALAANPYGQDVDDPKSVHLFFLTEPAAGRADLEPLMALAASGESLHLTDAVLYVHAPDGIGRSKMVEKIGKFVPVEMTARNLRTVLKIAEMARASRADG